MILTNSLIEAEKRYGKGTILALTRQDERILFLGLSVELHVPYSEIQSAIDNRKEDTLTIEYDDLFARWLRHPRELQIGWMEVQIVSAGDWVNPKFISPPEPDEPKTKNVGIMSLHE